MKRLFGFQSKSPKSNIQHSNSNTSKAPPQLVTSNVMNDAKGVAKSGETSKSRERRISATSESERKSPTLSSRPTAPKKSDAELWRSMRLVLTEDALLVRPLSTKSTRENNVGEHLKLSWSKSIRIERVLRAHNDKQEDELVTEDTLEIRGIIGIITLFSASYLLVITSLTDLGNLCGPTRQVYGIQGVAYVPLDYGRAKDVFQRLKRASQRSQVPTAAPLNNTSVSDTGSLHVKWAPQHIPNVVPDADSILSSSPSSSGFSTPTSAGVSIAPLAKTLADRLSFWKTRQAGRADEASLVSAPTRANIGGSTTGEDTLGELVDNIDSGDVDNVDAAQAVEDIVAAATGPQPLTAEEKNAAVEEKVLRELVRQYTKGGMYFAYSFDLSNSLQHKQQNIERIKKQCSILSDLDAASDDVCKPNQSRTEADDKVDPWEEPLAHLPLWRRIERKFWWNEHMLQPFIEAELHGYILPILQGFFQCATFHIPITPDPITPMPLTSEIGTSPIVPVDAQGAEAQLNAADDAASIKVEYATISRRSKERAGLRYQRRGIDADAHVANFVETEAIVRLMREDTENVFSFVQIRGSIPLFWSQPGYGLKPPPQLDSTKTSEQNSQAMRAHLANAIARYGPVSCVNLAEQTGKEGPITDAFRETMNGLGLQGAKYNEWDFHRECRGMRYENISKLIHKLERTFEQQGFYWTSGSTILARQKGVFRVNCIDCLDRTNVVQSAFARHVLATQLEAVAILHESGTAHTEAEAVFNDVWANNGDAISRAYAGTSALKGDYTRTGKRDLGGMLNDGINSLARVYTSTFSDWFSQSVIDFMLGYRGPSVFTEFLQTLSSSEPSEVIRLSKVREAAIEHASLMVIVNDERLTAGWTLLSPEALDVRLADKFEEKILLLTTKAIYIVSYDYSLEKVKVSTRVPLGDIVSIQRGAYILSTLNSQTRDPETNYGVNISFLAARQDTRITSYSVRNRFDLSGRDNPPRSATDGSFGATLSQILADANSPNKVVSVAFKCLPVDAARVFGTDGSQSATSPKTPKEAIERLVQTLAKACGDYGVVDETFLSEADIVSLAEAQKTTSVFARFEYNFKRLLWLGS
ncbi:related to SAC1-recessive suppressor of secretory defect [Serendipita indica DSM 11827]|uniref:Related to SAC1-recessive suppressor of secretory defect n=1 Tax=Serendipita indica (strain DSM 11827) TaxID=1109443 RepID=G4TD48_SERID|nr:related to SAC1-recessive suppressor of secretory defect [Serendipita indica DSM 11827]